MTGTCSAAGPDKALRRWKQWPAGSDASVHRAWWFDGAVAEVRRGSLNGARRCVGRCRTWGGSGGSRCADRYRGVPNGRVEIGKSAAAELVTLVGANLAVAL